MGLVFLQVSTGKKWILCVLPSQFLSSWKQLAPLALSGASHNGMMECVMSLVGPNGPLSEDVPLEDGGVVKEIRNTAPPGFNGWAIIRRHPPHSSLELQEKDKTSPKNQLSTDEIEQTFLGYITRDNILQMSINMLRAPLNESLSPSLLMCGIALMQVQHTSLVLVEPHEISIGSLHDLVQVSLDSILSFRCVNCTTQPGVICKFDGGALDLTVHVIDKDTSSTGPKTESLRAPFINSLHLDTQN
ncbi:hypothetical protein DUI87_16355 [Hirundo rustica rustica]|uniref:Uncharacterized protein n=1 Tax=Hirundo rustica rustica TaxID=333673 RepID=A0A3M0K116_HIRRU|nr:hypothetical protein DUI87_16355 [Hirundo rustica rustica]